MLLIFGQRNILQFFLNKKAEFIFWRQRQIRMFLRKYAFLNYAISISDGCSTVHNVCFVQSYAPVVKNALQQPQGNIGLPCSYYRGIIKFPCIYTEIGAQNDKTLQLLQGNILLLQGNIRGIITNLEFESHKNQIFSIFLSTERAGRNIC